MTAQKVSAQKTHYLQCSIGHLSQKDLVVRSSIHHTFTPSENDTSLKVSASRFTMKTRLKIFRREYRRCL